jgi:hypothetical protein
VKIYAIAHPASEVDEASFTIKGEGRQTEIKIGKGRPEVAPFDVFTGKEHIDIEISVRSNGRSVSVFGKHIPVDGDLHLFALSRAVFFGYIMHGKKQHVEGCKLQCTPSDTPVVGPGCIDCEKEGLIFKVCCR